MKRKLTPEQEQDLVDDYVAGMTGRKVAELYGVSYRTVIYILGRHGAPTRGRKGTSKQRKNRSGPVVPQPCGTDAAYNRHVAHKEIACDACLAAHREAGKIRKAKLKARREKENKKLELSYGRRGLKIKVRRGPNGIPIIVTEEE